MSFFSHVVSKPHDFVHNLNFYLVLKGCLTTEDDYLNVVKETLRNLQVDYIDLMLIHEPGVEGISNTSTDVITYRLAAWKALKKFKQQELIRSIGVSNFLIRHLESLKSELDVVPAVNQVEYHPMNYDLELLDYCKTNQILLQAHSVLGTTGNSSIRNNNLVSAIARDLNKSSVQILLKWALQRQVGVIPKASSRNHLKENIELNFEIPLEQMKLLDNLKNDYFMRLDIDPNEVI